MPIEKCDSLTRSQGWHASTGHRRCPRSGWPRMISDTSSSSRSSSSTSRSRQPFGPAPTSAWLSTASCLSCATGASGPDSQRRVAVIPRYITPSSAVWRRGASKSSGWYWPGTSARLASCSSTGLPPTSPPAGCAPGAAIGKSPMDRPDSGTKRSFLTDGHGYFIVAHTAGANTHHSQLLRVPLRAVVFPPLEPSRTGQRLCVDKVHDSPTVRVAAMVYGYVPHIRRSRDEKFDRCERPSQPGRRWVVERCVSLLSGSGRLWCGGPRGHLSTARSSRCTRSCSGILSWQCDTDPCANPRRRPVAIEAGKAWEFEAIGGHGLSQGSVTGCGLVGKAVREHTR